MKQDLKAAAVESATATPVKPRSRKRSLLIGAGLATLLGAIWYGYDWWTVGRWIQNTDDAYVGGNVTVIAPQVAGRIETIEIGDNQRVAAGQPILRIDPAPFEAVVQKATAAVAMADAKLATLQAQVPVQEASVAAAEADLTSRTAAARFAAQDAERYQSLAKADFGSQANAEKTQAANDQAQAGIRSATANLASARQQLKVIDSQIADAKAAADAARADLRTAQLNLSYTVIRAPIDGYIGHRSVDIGSYVGPGAYLLTLVPTKGLWVDANFKEDQLAGMRPGDPATLSVDAIPGVTFHGHVASFAPATGSVFSIIPAENATGNFTKIVQRVPVRILIDDAAQSPLLRPGLSALVNVDTKTGAEHAR
ncbi:HlyD family secretion protein [Thioclava sp. BHET1]|nr:HlyD family secretion protein [Thioclava sp. BHET1]